MDPVSRDIELEIKDLQRQIYDLRKRITEHHHQETIPQEGCSVLLCRTGEDQVAFLLDLVREVVPIASLTMLPESPSWVLGQLNLRGDSIPVLDVSARIEKRQREVKLSDLIVICEVKGRNVGLLVQEIGGVQEVNSTELMDGRGDIPHAPYLIAQFNHEGNTALVLSIIGLVESSDLPAEDSKPETSDRPDNIPANKKKSIKKKPVKRNAALPAMTKTPRGLSHE